MRFLFGLLFGILLVPAALVVYLYLGHGVPVAVADRPWPLETTLAHHALRQRVKAEMPARAPLEANATNLVLGAQIYRQQCAACHGLYGLPSSFAAQMFPHAPQLWRPHKNGAVGVSDDPPGATYWKVANGIRLTGMPAYKTVLSETQMWQVSILLAHADKPLPPAALDSLKQPIRYDLPPSAALPSPASGSAITPR